MKNRKYKYKKKMKRQFWELRERDGKRDK